MRALGERFEFSGSTFTLCVVVASSAMKLSYSTGRHRIDMSLIMPTSSDPPAVGSPVWQEEFGDGTFGLRFKDPEAN